MVYTGGATAATGLATPVRGAPGGGTGRSAALPVGGTGLQIGQNSTGYFLDVPDVPGESTDSAHRDEIDVLAWSWGMRRAVDAGTGRLSKPEYDTLLATKYVDRSTTELMRRFVDGTVIREDVRLSAAAPVGESRVDYLTVLLSNVLVVSHDVSTVEGSGPVEVVGLAFEAVDVTYRLFGAGGSVIEDRNTVWETATG